MKLRIDYVTNSSSSSFLLAYKEYDGENPAGRRLNAVMQALMDISGYDTREATICRNIEDLEDFFLDQYCYSSLEDMYEDSDGYFNGLLEKAKEYMNSGFVIAKKSIGHDDQIDKILYALKGDDLIILDGE